MFNSEFDGSIREELGSVNFVPAELREKVDEMNAWIYVGRRFQDCSDPELPC
jgi:glutathionyl-hydroquinone reductase